MFTFNLCDGMIKITFQYGVDSDDFSQWYTGDTVCKVLNSANELLGYGHSDCHPTDQFIKRTGRKIALSRALKQLKLNKEERTQIWKSLFPQYFRK